MVRTISEELAQAVAGGICTPAIRIILHDGFDRPATPMATEHAGRSALAPLDAVTYLRAYVDQPDLGEPAQIYTQIITTPTTTPVFTGYALRTSGAAGQAGVALGRFGGELWLFYQRLSDGAICYQTTTDGMAWSDEIVAATPGCTCWGLAAANGLLFAALDDIDDSAQLVFSFAWTGSAWTSGSPWPHDAGPIRGLTAVQDGGLCRLAIGTASRPGGGLAACVTTFDGSDWTATQPIHSIDDPNLGWSCPFPSIGIVDGRYAMAGSIYDDGSITGSANSHTELWSSPDFVGWHLENVVSGTTFTNGANIYASGVSGYFLYDAGTFLPSNFAIGASNPDLDLTPSLVALRIDEPVNERVRARVQLMDPDGEFTATPVPVDGERGVVRIGSQVLVSLGYGGDAVLTHTLYIDQITNSYLDSTELVRVTTIECSNRARLLDRQNPVPIILRDLTLAEAVTAVAFAGGIRTIPAMPATAQFSQVIDALSLDADVTFAETLNRLGGLYGFLWFIDEQEHMTIREASPSDTVDFTLGPAHTPVRGHAIGQRRRPNGNFTVASGVNVAVPSFAFTTSGDDASLYGEAWLDTQADRLLSATGAAIKSPLSARADQRRSLTGTIEIALHPGIQPLDIVALDDGAIQVTGRVVHIHSAFDARTAEFCQRLTLEAR